MPQNQPNPNKRYSINTEDRRLESHTVLEESVVEGASVPTLLVREDLTGDKFRCSLDYLQKTPREAWLEERRYALEALLELRNTFSGLVIDLDCEYAHQIWVERELARLDLLDELEAAKSGNANPRNE